MKQDDKITVNDDKITANVDSTTRVKSRAWLRPSRPKLRMDTIEKRDAAVGYLMIAPAVLGFAIFVAVPILGTFILSTQNYNALSGVSRYIGIDNYIRLANDPVFSIVMKNTFVFGMAVVPGNIVIGLALAILVNQRIPAISFFRTAYFVPVVMSLVGWSLVWGLFLQDRGALNGWLEIVGIAGPNWLASSDWAMFSVIVVQVLKSVGVSMILFLAALQGVPQELLEAAKVDGAGPTRTFWSITLPFISPTIILVSILATIGSLKTFALIYSLTGSGPGYSTSILGYFIYNQAFGALQTGYAAAASVVLFVIALGLTILQWWSRKRWVLHES